MTENVESTLLPTFARHCQTCSKRLAAMNHDVRCFTCIDLAQKLAEAKSKAKHLQKSTLSGERRRKLAVSGAITEPPVKVIAVAPVHPTFGMTPRLYEFISSLRPQSS